MLSVAFLIFGGLFGIGVVDPTRDTWLLNQIIAFAPARLDGDEHELEFDKAVAYATQHQKPLFLDFTGVNCVNCRLMEKKMAKKTIARRLEKFVQARLYCDKVPTITDLKLAAQILDRNITLEKEWFGDVTLPSYAIVTSDGKTILATTMGLANSDAEFTRFLDEGYAKWSSTK
jgi:thiol:disulfide interchange protein DsbD